MLCVRIRTGEVLLLVMVVAFVGAVVGGSPMLLGVKSFQCAGANGGDLIW